MANCRRRFGTEPEVKKHIDNHLNPHSTKARRAPATPTHTTTINANNLTNTIAAVASGAAEVLASKGVGNFRTLDVNKNNISPRMTPIKHELYFPQCYGLPFNQPFHGGSTVGGATLVQETSNAATDGPGENNNNSVESSPVGITTGSAIT